MNRRKPVDDGGVLDTATGPILDAAKSAVKFAEAEGLIGSKDSAAVAMFLRMADRMDDPDFPYIDGRFDNVTEGLFLKTARELGLTVGGRLNLPEKTETRGGKLGELRGERTKRQARTG